MKRARSSSGSTTRIVPLDGRGSSELDSGGLMAEESTAAMAQGSSSRSLLAGAQPLRGDHERAAESLDLVGVGVRRRRPVDREFGGSVRLPVVRREGAELDEVGDV